MPNLFKCKKCERSFKTKESLGGHSSSHNRGDSYREGRKKEKLIILKNYICRHCGDLFENGFKLGGHQNLCKLNPLRENTINKIKSSSKGKQLKETTKEKISAARIKYLNENPDKHPWKKNDKFKSIPCEYFKNILKNNGVLFEEEFSPVRDRFFSTDIAFVENKICIEINGEQHYDRKGDLKKYYKDRNELIENSGWTVIEIHYSKVYDSEYVKSIIEKIKKAHS